MSTKRMMCGVVLVFVVCSFTCCEGISTLRGKDLTANAEIIKNAPPTVKEVVTTKVVKKKVVNLEGSVTKKGDEEGTKSKVETPVVDPAAKPSWLASQLSSKNSVMKPPAPPQLDPKSKAYQEQQTAKTFKKRFPCHSKTNDATCLYGEGCKWVVQRLAKPDGQLQAGTCVTREACDAEVEVDCVAHGCRWAQSDAVVASKETNTPYAVAEESLNHKANYHCIKKTTQQKLL